jgi:hypothetical protein
MQIMSFFLFSWSRSSFICQNWPGFMRQNRCGSVSQRYGSKDLDSHPAPYRSLMSQIRNTACNHCRWSGSALFVRNNILSTGLLDPIFVHVTSVVDPDPLWLGSHGSESLLGMWVRIQEQGNWPILPVFQKRDVLIFESFWCILKMLKNATFCDG